MEPPHKGKIRPLSSNIKKKASDRSTLAMEKTEYKIFKYEAATSEVAVR